MRVSACVIVKNEAKNLEKFLPSVKPFVDEIILVDSGSEDNSRQIALQYGAQVFSYVWQDDFAAARNFAIEKAQGDWILFLDADEAFSLDSGKKVRMYLEKFLCEQEVEAIACEIVNIDVDRENHIIGSFPNVRIFKNRSDIRYVGKIHERVQKDGGGLKICFLTKELKIYHTGYSKRIIKQKLRRNLKLLELDIQENGINTQHYRYLADCYHGLGDWEKTYHYAKLYIQNTKNIMEVDTTIYCKMLFAMQKVETDSQKICRAFEKTIALFPTFSEFYMQYGDYCNLVMYDYNKALDLYKKAAALYKGEKSVFAAQNFQGYADWCYVRIGEIYEKQRRSSEAAEAYIQALQIERYNKQALKHIIRLLGMNPHKQENIAVLNQIYRLEERKDLEFLLANLEQTALDEVYVYYLKKLEAFTAKPNIKHDLYRLLAVKNEKKLQEECLYQLNEKQAALFLHYFTKKECRFEEIFDRRFQLVWSAVKENQKFLPDMAGGAFLSILKECILCEREIDLFLECIRESSQLLKMAVINLLMEHNQYRAAQYVYTLLNEKQLSFEEIGEKAICLFKNGKYSAAAACFERMAQKGELATRYKAYHKWAAEKKGDRQDITSIIMLTHNQLAYTKLCLESLRRYTKADTYELIVVDNASTDGTVEWLKQQSDIRLILNDENKGFPGGCNQGIEIAVGTEILLLNNDTILTKGWLTDLKQALYSEPYIGAVGCVASSCSNWQQVAAGYKELAGLQAFAKQIKEENQHKWEKRARLIGFCMLIRQSCVDELGGLDERFTPGNYEDDDYSYRLRKAGYELLVCRDVFLHHFGGASFHADVEKSRRYAQLLAVNADKFTAKWGLTPLQLLAHYSIDCWPGVEAMLYVVVKEAFTQKSAEIAAYLSQMRKDAAFTSTQLLEAVLKAVDEKSVVDMILFMVDHLEGKLALGLCLAAYNAGIIERALVKRLAQLLCQFDKQKNALEILLKYPDCDDEMKQMIMTLRQDHNELFAPDELPISDKALPLVSILIPTYNRPDFFAETFQSALLQTYPNVEVIVCDNSTNEKTYEYMQKYIHHPRVTYFRNRTAKTKRENFIAFRDLKLVHGEYMQWLMDDDLIHQDKLAIMIPVFLQHKNITLVTSVRQCIDANGNVIENRFGTFLKQTSLVKGRLVGKHQLMELHNDLGEPSTVLFRVKDLQDHYWEASCREYISISDVAMWMQLLERGDLLYITEPLSSFRIHNGQEQNNFSVIVNSRNEWLHLITEYFQRRVFIEKSSEYRYSLNKWVNDSKNIMAHIVQCPTCVEPQVFRRYKANLDNVTAYLNEMIDEKTMYEKVIRYD